jgi:predicted dehydrogenase
VSRLPPIRIGWGNPHDDVDPVWVLAPHDLSISLEVMSALPRPQSAIAQMHDGRVAGLSAVLASDGWWQTLEVSARSPARTRRVELHCEEGVAVLSGGWDEHVAIFRGGSMDAPEETRIETPGELPLLAELRAFVEHLRGGPAPKSGAADGAAIVATLAELRRLAGAA